jgi:nucleoside recognition membrane protein YjiH
MAPSLPKLRFWLSTLLGGAFFLLPIPAAGGRFTVPFDLLVQSLVAAAPAAIGVYALLVTWLGVVRSDFRGTPLTSFLRVVGGLLALLYFFDVGPGALKGPAIAGLMWGTLVLSIAVIVPIGAAALAVFVEYGILELVGVLMRPVMRPLFRLPGRSALDSLTSWVGSYSVGLYLTRQLLEAGYYTRREAFVITTCFSTVSIGFVAVVAGTLDLLRLFPLIMGTYFVVVYCLAIVLSRVWPSTSTPDDYVTEPRPELPATGESLLRTALSRAFSRAAEGAGFVTTLGRGFREGFLLVSTILGSVLAVGTLALLLARETPLFDWLGRPLVPVLTSLGLPDARIIAPAVVVGISEMYIPALLARNAALPARFFIAVLSISQLVFFSSVGPMMIDMFRKVPIRAHQLVAIFFMRTVLLVPPIALLSRWLT